MNIYHRISAILLPSVILIDRFLYTLPDWLAFTLLIPAMLLFGVGIYKDRQAKLSNKLAEK